MLDRMQLGEVPKKHHIAFRKPDGGLFWEECFTRDGFDAAYSILYHQHRPHEGSTIPGFQLKTLKPEPGQVGLSKKHVLGGSLVSQAVSKKPLASRVPVFFNPDVVLSVMSPAEPDDVIWVNADGDDLYYIHEGGGTLKSIFGDLDFVSGDYVMVPRGTLHRFIPSHREQFWFSIECTGGLHLPRQWRNETGQLRMEAPYCHRDFKRPVLADVHDELIRTVAVKRQGQFYGFAYPNNPMDVVGWDGSVYPWAFPILNFQPRAGLVHLPPTWHGTFACKGGLVCSFVPRMTDFHPEAIPCPYPHASVNVDEVIFYCKGNFTSRKGVGPKSLSFHPAGIPHGPHPGSYEKSIGTKGTDELAVMLDCEKPLQITTHAEKVLDPNYELSFIDAR